MPHIKKLVMHGFKSFARKTEIHFEDAMNIIVGPNGSGKSNITDALCFVLGRLSIKSIRAAKAANLLFSGNKIYKASQEASVELVFDNSDKVFAIDSTEVSIKRIVRKNGQSVYKINEHTKTRQELLELLAQAGIDPNGFNIVLQGEIDSLIKSNAEDRRKIIEEVAGISIYETRKQKSLRELEKTDEKIKEVSAVLKEKGIYLKNLDKERQDALNHQKLEQTIKKCKKTILDKTIKEKQKEVSNLDKEIENQDKEIEKLKKQISEKNSEIKGFQEKINKISKQVQEATSDEQEKLHKEISDLKARVAGLDVRKENFETRLQQNAQKQSELKQKIESLEKEISEIQSATPKIKKQKTELKQIQEKFDLLEKYRRQFYIIRSEISTLENSKSEKQNLLLELKKEVELINKNIETSFDEIKYAKSVEQAETIKRETKNKIQTLYSKISELEKQKLVSEKKHAISEQEIKRAEKLKQDIPYLNICPLCKSRITKEHIKHVLEDANQKIEQSEKQKSESEQQIKQTEQEANNSNQILRQLEIKLNEIEIDAVKLKNAENKKQEIIKVTQNQKQIRHELEEIENHLEPLAKKFESLKNIEQEYDDARMELQELSFADTSTDTESAIKQRELNRIKTEQKAIVRDIEESESELKKITKELEQKNKIVEKNEIREEQLYEKCEKLFSDKNALQDQQKAIETEVIGLQHTSRNHEEKINAVKIQKAQFNAQLDSLKTEITEFRGIEIIQQPIEQIRERLQKSELKISQFGSVNMRALEVYDKVREQCKLIGQKVEIIEIEKEKIMKIILEIDKKKKRSFVKTLDAVNEYFTRNFSQLSKKGEVFLEAEDKQDPFAGGLNILIKVGRGKYFDVTSLSGGEKALVALSLIFAIQEYKPYYFYVFDEIDAALDKHNSELLAALIKKYMLSGQYVIITHNDALIGEATTLYGVSMQENLSKVISLKI